MTYFKISETSVSQILKFINSTVVKGVGTDIDNMIRGSLQKINEGEVAKDPELERQSKNVKK